MTRIALIVVALGGLSGFASSSANAGRRSTTPQGGGCVDKSQNGWTVRLCANKSSGTVAGDFYVLKKGSPGAGCRISGAVSVADDSPLYNNFGVCSGVGVNQQEVIGNISFVFAGATVKVCVAVDTERPLAQPFAQCATFNNV
jgi:hypothetical protein